MFRLPQKPFGYSSSVLQLAFNLGGNFRTNPNPKWAHIVVIDAHDASARPEAPSPAVHWRCAH